MIKIRKAVVKDVDQLQAIYNWAIENTTGTFDTETKSYENRVAWLTQREPQFFVLVAEIEKEANPITGTTAHKEITGYISLNKWSDRKAYDITAEVSFYVKPEYQGLGLGTQLLGAAIEEAKKLNLVSLLSRITQGNKASLVIHSKFDFETVGIMKKVGVKFDRLLDVVMLQKLLK